MERLLMHQDIPVLKFDLDDCYIEVLNNNFLPYQLKDFIKTTDIHNFKKSLIDIEILKDFFLGRTLNFSRENAKAILNSANLSQSLSPSQKLEITFACHGLSITDSFWIKSDKNQTWENMNLRTNHLYEVSYEIAILGKNISVTSETLSSDLSTLGMFPKYWKREDDGIFLWKTDKTNTFVNTKAELLTSRILEQSNIPSIKYIKKERNNMIFAISKCFVNDEYSFVPAQHIMDYCSHTNTDFSNVIKPFITDFANMCMLDYIVANGDRHNENWGFFVDNQTNEITSFAPLFDHNQAFIADYLQVDVNQMMHTASGLNFEEMKKKYAKDSTIILNRELLPTKASERYQEIRSLQKEHFQEKIFNKNVSLNEIIQLAENLYQNSGNVNGREELDR